MHANTLLDGVAGAAERVFEADVERVEQVRELGRGRRRARLVATPRVLEEHGHAAFLQGELGAQPGELGAGLVEGGLALPHRSLESIGVRLQRTLECLEGAIESPEAIGGGRPVPFGVTRDRLEAPAS